MQTAPCPTRTRLVAAAALAALAALHLGAAVIYQEGEDAASAKVARHPWWYDKVKTNELSGGAWISHYSKAQTGEVSYAITAPETNEYAFWLRANPIGAKLSWQLDGGAWQPVNFSEPADSRNIAADDKPDMRFIAWVNPGTVKLSAGAHTLAFMMHSDTENHGAIDRFVLTTEPFAPYGIGPSAGTAANTVRVFSSSDSWAFEPPEDSFGSNAVIDLRYLNEKNAGDGGFIRRSADGMSFEKGNGEPIRFWSAVDDARRLKPEEMDVHCRFIAKLGVNMVRIHAGLYNATEGAQVTDINEEELDAIFRFVAACKKNGIYLTISPFWANVGAPKSWGLEGYANESPWGVLFFNEHFQEGYKAWVKELYTRTNKYTGIPLKDEPAVAIIQIKNEDGLLFWTFQGIKEPQLVILRKKYGDWLVRRYGSLEKAKAAWKGMADAKDDFAKGAAGFLPMWEMTSESPRWGNGRQERLADQTEFIAWIQRAFYDNIGTYYHDTLDCKQLVNAMNWRSADSVALGDVERWTYTANEVLAINRYTVGTHIGENNGYRIDPGHFYINNSVLRDPTTLPCALKQVVGYPMIITECAWVHPELYQSEGPFLAAAYMSLTGVDSLYWFALGDKTWLRDPRRMFWPVKSSYAIDKWSGSVPQQIGQFPANALAFRLGYITPASAPVVYEERSLSNMWNRTIPVISEEGMFDPNRDQGAFATRSSIRQEVDRLAFLVGPVHVKYGGDEKNSRVAPDLNSYISREKKTVKSVTGQMLWNYGVGVCTVNAPKYQGVAGFLREAGGVFALGDVTICSSNEYATIVVTALDNQPLAQSEKVLVQVGTVVRMTGWTTQEKRIEVEKRKVLAEEILDTGKPPWRIANTRATISIKNPRLAIATLLDTAGYPAVRVPVSRAGETLSVKLPLNTMYLVLEAAPPAPAE